jgi:ParB/RepB/Spo0J family partition protein
MMARARKVDKGSVLDFDGLGFADETFLADAPSEFEQAKTNLHVRPVRLSQIRHDSPFQTRQAPFDPEVHPEDEELLESIQANGVLEPVMVLELSEPGELDVYQIVFGHRRVAAARLAGLEEILAMVTRDEDEARILTLAENMGGRALTPYERALALSSLKEAYPDLSVRALGQRTGIPFQTVSTLLRAYTQSPPALRGMFAEGLAPGSVLELNNVFEATPESEHASLAGSLKGLTRRQAQAIRSMVGSGMVPAEAVQTVLDPELPQRTLDKQAEDSLKRSEIDENTIETYPPHTPLPSVNDREIVEAIADATGASSAKVKRLVELARLAHVDLDVLTFTCLYPCGRDEEGEAIQLAKLTHQDPRTKALVNRYFRLRKGTQRQLETVDDTRKVKFVSKIIMGR